MIYKIFASLQELQDIVKQYVVINSLDGLESLLFLPNGCNFIVFNRGFEGYTKVHNEDEKYFMPRKYFVSMKTNKVKKFILSDKEGSKSLNFPVILVELTPVGFYKLFNKDAYLLNKKHLELENDIIDRYFKDLYSHNSLGEELKYLDTSLSALNSSQNNSHMPIEDVIDKIINSYHFEVTVESLIKESGCSRSTMERNFKKIIGLTPKNFIYISKFCRTVLACIEKECTFNELEYLYSDNSYMNAVFKKFLGVSPSVISNQVSNSEIRIYQMKRLKD